jgi:hypothetical protein
MQHVSYGKVNEFIKNCFRTQFLGPYSSGIWNRIFFVLFEPWLLVSDKQLSL